MPDVCNSFSPIPCHDISPEPPFFLFRKQPESRRSSSDQPSTRLNENHWAMVYLSSCSSSHAESQIGRKWS